MKHASLLTVVGTLTLALVGCTETTHTRTASTTTRKEYHASPGLGSHVPQTYTDSQPLDTGVSASAAAADRSFAPSSGAAASAGAR